MSASTSPLRFTAGVIWANASSCRPCAQEHRHKRPDAVHVWMRVDHPFHQLCRLIRAASVVQRERTKREHERVVGIAGGVELAERLVKLAHVHVDQRATITRDQDRKSTRLN